MFCFLLISVTQRVSGSSAKNSYSNKSVLQGAPTLVSTLRPRLALQAIARHQSIHAAKTDGFIILDHSLLHPTCTQHATAIFMHVTDATEQVLVVELAVADPAPVPGWPAPASSGTSIELEAHRGNVRSRDTSG